MRLMSNISDLLRIFEKKLRDMFTKLTLNISQPVIERAKQTARKKRISLSRLVESFLKELSEDGNESIVASIIKNAPVKKTKVGSEKDTLKKALLKKYGS